MKRVWIAISLCVFCVCRTTRAEDLTAGFSTDPEGWAGSPGGVTVIWQAAGGYPDGHLSAQYTNDSPWHFSAPASWTGDWSAYRVVSWDLKLLSGDYADSNANDILVIEGVNGSNLVWHGPSPIWEWSHYDVVLEPVFFGVDETTFNDVITNVAALRILGEYQGGRNESTGLDSVVVTTNAVPVHAELRSAFDADDEGWRPYDDVTLSWQGSGGNPDGFLHGDDWADGRIYHFGTPLSWAGDWRNFRLLTFDLIKFGSGASGEFPLVRIRGANGEELAWNGPGPGADWTGYEVYLVPENFGVDQATFDGVMSYVTEMLIRGEFRTGGETEGLDNVALTTEPPPVMAVDLISSFDSDLEDWLGGGDCNPEWLAEGGNPGGFFHGRDLAQGITWYFVTPQAWRGSWLTFTWLQFQLKSLAGSWSFYEEDMVRIIGMNGRELVWTGHIPQRSWTHYFIPLTPEAFGTDQATFHGVMAYVKEIRIHGEVAGGTDRAGLDSFGLYIARPPFTAPEQASTFDADMEAWRKYDGITLAWEPAGGNPDGFLKGYSDGSGIWHYVSPESWSGDWGQYRSLRFDHIILSGVNAQWTHDTLYILGANNQTMGWDGPEASNVWRRFEANLSPALFGVDAATYDAVMGNVVEVRIRGEYVSGGESEGLDNVYLSKSPLGGVPPLEPGLLAAATGTVLAIQCQTESNVYYQLQACTNLAEGTWSDVAGELMLGDGQLGTLEVDMSGSGPSPQSLRLRAY